MQQEIVFSGFGGQGVMLAGQLLAYAAMAHGREVTWIPSYGPEMRGGTAHCFVVISDKPIGSPAVKHPSVAIVFNNPSFDKYAPLVAPGGLLVVNQSLVQHTCDRDDIDVLAVPATAMAGEMGENRLTNMFLLGAALQARDSVPLDVVRASLAEHIPAHRRNLLELNFEALRRGAAFAAEHGVAVSS
ncbi:MAG: 2-oxoacid:acceptor oxidoreductase family protein [Phototrophicaceae bacterium]